uniref:Coiled-coil domain-containing protein 86 n=1 Tax=Setaria italica TaxID=4555 RepID=K3YYC6_SETIT
SPSLNPDFRYLDEGLGGKRGKRKRREEEEEAEAAAADSMDLDADAPRPSKLRAMPSLSDTSKPASFGQPTYDGVIAGRVSGRRWKEPRTRRASAVVVSRKPTPLEQRVREKSLKRAYQARKAELKETRQNKKCKQENVLRTGTKLQRVTNPKTIQKIAKSKKCKQLKVVPDEFLGGKKSEASRRMQVPGLEN